MQPKLYFIFVILCLFFLGNVSDFVSAASIFECIGDSQGKTGYVRASPNKKKQNSAGCKWLQLLCVNTEIKNRLVFGRI